MPSRLWPILVAVLVSSAPARSAEPRSSEGLDAATFSRDVVAANADLLAATNALAAAQARARGAGGFPNPTASVGVAPLAFAPDAQRVGIEVGLEQRVPISGRLHLARQAADSTIVAAEADLAVLRLDLALAAFELAEDRWLVERGLDRTAEELAIAEEVDRATRAAFAAGAAGQADALDAERAVESVRARRASLVGAHEAVEARMNALLHRPVDSPLPPAVALPLDVSNEPSPARAEEDRARSELGESESTELLARRAWIPDLVLMTSYSTMWDAPEHRWLVGVSADLPVASRTRRADVDEATARSAQLSWEVAAVRDAVDAEQHSARSEAAAAHEVAALHADRILPLAQDQLEVTQTAFAAGTAGYPQLSDAVRDWLESAQEADETASAARRADARLIRSMGSFPGGAP